jgi:KDO2-lipid IV(A) lauroyltransferase
MRLSRKQRKILKSPLYLLEFALAWPFIQLLRLLPFKWISNLGGFLGRLLGHFCRRHVATTNLKWAFPDITDQEIKRILSGMYDNFGRTFLEFLHLDKIDPKRMNITITVHGRKWLESLAESGKPAIFFSGHIGNWEIGPWVLNQFNIPLTPIYRHLNNPYLDRWMRKLRLATSAHVILKGPRSGQECFRALKKGQRLVLLADQKMNEGIDIPFFNRLAATPIGIAKLALAADVQIFPSRVKRINKTNFELTIFPPLTMPNSEDPACDIMIQVNEHLESWIRETPEQWFWVHRRWRKEDYYEDTKNLKD